MEERITLDEIHQKWTELFWSEETYQKWLDSELPDLHWETPRKWLDSKDASIQEIRNLLHRMEHWIFA